jgi:hypothetical protein
LLFFTQDQIDNNAVIEMEVQSGARPQDTTERFDANSVNIFTDQIIKELFGTEVLAGFPSDGLKTPTFTTPKHKYQYTTQDDLMNFVRNLANNNQKAHWFSLGKTRTLNFDMPIVIVTNSYIPAGSTFEQAAKIIRENDKATFFHKATIHGEEESGTEGALALLMEMVGSYGEKYLEKVNYVCIPRINVEGAARFQRNNLSQQFDMNGDHLRLKALENRMVHNAYLELMPEAVMDGHEIGYYTVTSTTSADVPAYATGGITDVEATPATSMNSPLMETINMGLDLYGYNLHKILADSGLRSNHYENGSNGWTCNHGVGRAYYGLMGSISMLVEVRGSATLLMARRAYAQMMSAKAILETLYDNDVITKEAVKKARESAIAKGKVYDPNVKVYLYQYASGAGTNYMNTGAETPGSKYTNYYTRRYQADMLGNIIKVNPADANMILKAHAINDSSHYVRSRPTAYIIPKGVTPTSINSGDYAINYDYILEMMGANRIEYYEIEPGTSAPVRQYYYVSGSQSASFTATETINANALVADLRPEENVVFEHGAYVIPLDQVAGAVAVCTFEPDIANSNGSNGTIAQSLSSATEGLALVFRDLETNNYPYYRLEKDNPREVLKNKDKKPEKPCKIEDILEEAGCNAGYGILLILFTIPFVLRSKK